MKSVEFIYFDLGNVILNFSHQLACQQISECAGVPFQRVWEVLFEGDLQKQYETGLISTAEFHRLFCEQTDSDAALPELLHAGSDIFELNVEISPVVTALASANCPIGILSNTCAAHWEHIVRKYRIVRDCFPVATLSYQVQSMKPDALIFEKAIDAAGVKPDQIFFMDDRPENVAGAIAAGFDAVEFHSAGQLASQLMDRKVNFNM